MSFPMETKIVGLVKTSSEDSYIYGEGKNYIIPEYQREYSWGENQIESFITSIKRAIDGESVFMGTVQFAYESTNASELHIIDGQQRMTTFLLLCNILEKQTGKKILSQNNCQQMSTEGIFKKIEYLQNLHFDDDDIEFLRQLVVYNFRHYKIIAFPQTFDFILMFWNN